MRERERKEKKTLTSRKKNGCCFHILTDMKRSNLSYSHRSSRTFIFRVFSLTTLLFTAFLFFKQFGLCDIFPRGNSAIFSGLIFSNDVFISTKVVSYVFSRVTKTFSNEPIGIRKELRLPLMRVFSIANAGKLKVIKAA